MSSKHLPLFNIIAVLILILASLPNSNPAAQAETPIILECPVDESFQTYPQPEGSENKWHISPENQLNSGYNIGSISLGGAAFQLYDTRSVAKKKSIRNGCVTIATDSVKLDAQIYLPYNAIITGFDAFIYDEDSVYGVNVRLKRYSYTGFIHEEIAFLEYSDYWRDGNLFIYNYDLNHQVDNDNYSYTVEAGFVAGDSVILCHANVYYITPKDPIFPMALPLINN